MSIFNLRTGDRISMKFDILKISCLRALILNPTGSGDMGGGYEGET